MTGLLPVVWWHLSPHREHSLPFALRKHWQAWTFIKLSAAMLNSPVPLQKQQPELSSTWMNPMPLQTEHLPLLSDRLLHSSFRINFN
jgi:hypothetical protein